LGKKPLETIQLVLQNVDGILNNTKREMKLDCLRTIMEEYDIDIMALSELSAETWDKLNYKDRIEAKTRGSWEACHWSTSHNKQDQFGEEFQPGRMAILV